MGKDVQRLSAAFSSRMLRTARDAQHTFMELGVINGELALVTDSFKVPIPKGDYMLAMTLTGSFDTSRVSDGGEGASAHVHRLPDNFRAIKPGDRVLVAWCGNEAVVASVVAPS